MLSALSKNLMRYVSLPALLVLAACGAAATPRPSVSAPPPAGPALVRIVAKSPQDVIALLGSPTLDRTEGPGRLLQFARPACVLDVYFYPDPQSGRAAARHVEARLKDGRTYDASACVAAQLRVQPLG